VFSVPADGSGGTPEQVAPDGHFHPQGWTASGELVVARVGAGTADLFRVAPRKDATLQVVQATPASEGMAATVSPDGKWVAYAADTTGRNEIWVRPLPGPGAAVRVSPDGGFDPVWARNGRELFYFADAERLMSVAVELGAAFNFKAPVELFRRTILNTTQPPLYDVLPDGRFVTIIPAEAAQAPISVILNWDRVLAARPAAR
jgi:serine/threonine-protein kinase